ncbi:MAG: acetyl-CoA carboxylase carboxyltransferase subunit beta [Lachnospiraceae bacterium]|nr:acetyl-CoA carboxylase carboxyltransferase subunit beta [Lachnospiraceae bacterium]
MNLDHVFKKTNKRFSLDGDKKPQVPEGLLCKCSKCGGTLLVEDVRRSYYVCPKCKGYFRVKAYERIRRLADEGSFAEWDKELIGGNPMEFEGYEEKLAATRLKSRINEAVVTGKCRINGCETVLGVMDGRFLMASMGAAVGEKITRAVERATKEKLPVILFTCSGGARMQEGITSLMQMAKTSAALKRHSDAGLLYVSVLTDPTTGGVTASFAMEGDIILAEPGALIGFAGPRVIEQTIRQKLPKGFQKSEFLLEHGFVDRIVERDELKQVLGDILRLHIWQDTRQSGRGEQSDLAALQSAIEAQTQISREEKRQRYQKIGVWDRVLRSRDKDRPVGSDYVEDLFEGFYEFHGDRYFGDDLAVMGGIAWFEGRPVTVIAQEKGKNTKENILHHFGMCAPEGYRKALRLMKQAEKFGRPVICLVDTPGAFCGLEAEERGQGEAIARNIYEMSGLKTPVLTVIIGEGGSGGALALAVSNEVWMLENSIYSILSPEGFASILWKDSKKAKQAAEVMKLTARDLKKAGIVEHVFGEPRKFSKETLAEVTEPMRAKIRRFLDTYGSMDTEALQNHRYERFRNM